MVSLKIRKKGKKTYYYMSHTYRDKSKVRTKEIYLGTALPRDIAGIKKKFVRSLYSEKWFIQLEEIKKSYQNHLSKTPGEVKRKNIEAFVVRFTYDTNRIEGSKLSFKDTAALLELGLSPKDRPLRDIKEAESHRKVFYEMLNETKQLSLGMILRWHKEIFGDTKQDIAGRLRNYQVYISGSEFTPPNPEAVEAYTLDFFKWYSDNKETLNPVELAALAHLKFETIHPFGDGNGRIGRLIMNFILSKNGYPMLDIRYTDRRSYYNALQRSNLKNDDNIFVLWFFRRYLKESRIFFRKLGK